MAPASEILSLDDLNKLTRKSRDTHLSIERSQSLNDGCALWQRLLATVHHPSVSDRHMTAACNAICFTAREYSCSNNRNVQALAYSTQAWNDIFSAARSAFASGKNKPALQVLDTLAYLAESNKRPESVHNAVRAVAMQMVKIVYTQRPRKCLKEACIVLFFFLRKLSDFMSFSDVLKVAYNEIDTAVKRLGLPSSITVIPDSSVQSPWFSFITALLMALRVTESKSATLKLLSLLCSLPPKIISIDPSVLIRQAIDAFASSDEMSLDDVTRDVLPAIVTSKEQFDAFVLRSNHVAAEVSTILLTLALLRYGKSRGYVGEQDLPRYLNHMLFHNLDLDLGVPTSEYAGSRALLENCSAAVRHSAFELLTSSTSPKTPIPSAALQCLVASLPVMHNDLDAFYRCELLSTSRRFLTRLRLNLPALCMTDAVTTDAVTTDAVTTDAIVDEVQDCFEAYIVFLKSELEPHRPYSRHILALELLCFLAETCPSTVEHSIHHLLADPGLHKALFRLVFDPYDDIRRMSTMALEHAASSQLAAGRDLFQASVHSLQPLPMAVKLAASTNRADQADALGRLVSLLGIQDTSKSLNSTEVDQCGNTYLQAMQLLTYTKSIDAFTIAGPYPLHGHILGLSYSLPRQNLKSTDSMTLSLEGTLLTICGCIWQLSQAHLCVDSPEMEDDMTEETTTSGPKDLLAYAWRALRDSNILMQAMLACFQPTMHLLRTIGDLCFEQLRLLRHRGAFSAVAQTFLLCCQQSLCSADKKARALTELWFDKALKELEYQADKLTRRSAGLPAMLGALLDPTDIHRFEASFQALVDIAMHKPPAIESTQTESNLRLPQVHALNCIKDVITNSRFRKMTEPLVMLTTNLAVESMSSHIWAIKNCGLMLLRASINRLDPNMTFGTGEAGPKLRNDSSTGRTAFDVAMDLLQSTSIAHSIEEAKSKATTEQIPRDTSTEAVFAGLDLLGRLYLAKHETATVKTLVVIRLSHHLWHVRAQAARLLAKLTPDGEELDTIREFLHQVAQEDCINASHGRLLVVRGLVERMFDSCGSRGVDAEVWRLLKNPDLVRQVEQSAILAASRLEIMHQLLKSSHSISEEAAHLQSPPNENTPHFETKTAESRALYDRAHAMLSVQKCCATTVENMNGSLQTLLKDEDAVLAAMRQLGLTRVRPLNHDVVQTAIELLQVVIAEDIRAAVMLAIVENCRQGAFFFAPGQIGSLARQINFEDTISKELLLCQLSLYTVLCAWSSAQKSEDCLKVLEELGTSFCLHLQEAVQDLYDDSTRMRAVEVLLQLSSTGDASAILRRILGSRGSLQIMSIVYDLLNDDDSEIRDAVAALAAQILNCGSEAVTDLKIFAAVVTRNILREHMRQEFGASEALKLECLRRLLGFTMCTSMSRLRGAIVKHVTCIPVETELENLVENAKDLFAEEKQNLYIDGVEEIRAWATVLHSEHLGLGDYLRVSLDSWVTKGIEALRIFLDTASDKLGTTYNIDLEMLVIRVVVMARVLGGHDEALEVLRERCSSLNVPASVLSCFTWSLR